MTALVVLLRGVNVGGKNKLAMADLRGWLSDAGFAQVQTYIQSGNIVLSAGAAAATVAGAVHDLIVDKAGLDVPVVVRTGEQVAAVVAANPFLARGEEAGACHVAFGTAPAVEPDRKANLPDEAIAVGSDLFLFLPDGTARSKLAAAVARATDPAYTVRNWRTVTKLADLAAGGGQTGR